MTTLRRPAESSLWVAAAAALAAGVTGAAVVGMPALAILLAGLPILVLTVPLLLRYLDGAVTFGGRKIGGVIWLILACSTMVWRTRSTAQLQSNPLDGAALIRVGFVFLAAVCVTLLLLRPQRRYRLPASLVFLGLYLAVSLVAAAASPLPMFAGYRSFELAVGLGAALVIVASGERNPFKIVDLVLIVLAGLLAVIWFEALVFPSRVWDASAGFLPYQLTGYFPAFSSNTVGLFGTLLAVWGLGEFAMRASRRVLPAAAAAFGLVTIVASLYRTGFVALVICVAIILWQRRQPIVVFSLLLLVVASFAVTDLQSLSGTSQQLFQLGRPESVTTLDSRTIYWRASEKVILERPLIGWGLNVGSRRVLTSLGNQDISTIHGTWFEALLGAGVVGVTFLALALASAARDAWRLRNLPSGLAVFCMIIVIAVRSLTGSTVELFDIPFLIFGALALASGAALAPGLGGQVHLSAEQKV